MYALYRWRDFLNNDPTEVRAWTDGLLSDNEARHFGPRDDGTCSWSHGMGDSEASGDRVARNRIHMQIGEH